MPTVFAVCLVAALAIGTICGGDALPAPAAAAAPSIDALSWLSGAWETAAGPMQQEEHWTHIAGGSMLGTGRLIVEGRMRFFEYLRIETRADGVYYVAHPKARCPGTDFKLVEASATTATFENPAHDFPKRIRYRLEPDGTLFARVEGDGTEREQPQEYRFKRRGG